MIIRTWLTALALLLGISSSASAGDDALIAAAKKEGEVVWYTVQTIPQIVTPLVAAFEQKYGIKVTYVRANSSDVAIRILNEAKGGRVLADVFDGTGTLPPLLREGLVAQWLPDFVSAWPKDLFDANRYWVATNAFVNTVAINTDLVKPQDEPKTWDDLLDPKWKGRMAWGSTPSPSAGPGFIALMYKVRGEAGATAYLSKLAAQNIAGYPVAARQILDQVIAGEYAIGIMVFNHHPVISAAKGAPTKWLPVGPALKTFNTASVMKDAPHPNAARLFLEYMVGEEGQKLFRDNDYLSANPKVPPKDPGLLPDGKKFEGVFISQEEFDRNMPKWVEIFRKMFR